jgi:hypothetical protein
MVPLCSGRIARVPPYSSSLTSFRFRLQGYHLLWPDFPDCSTTFCSITTTGLFPFRSPLLRESRLISFPPVTEMFQFTGFAPNTYLFSAGYLLRGGFPHSEIAGSKVVCHLADAYRRLPRPSSPSTAKASTMCAYSLDHITSRSLRFYVIRMESGTRADFSHCERDIFKLDNELSTINKSNRLKITAFKQKTFQIVKERTMREAPRDHSSSQWTARPAWARVIAHHRGR